MPSAFSLQPSAVVRVGSIKIGPGQPLVLIAGPDVIESEPHLLSHAERIAKLCERAGVSYIVKSSYDKANRTSGRSFRGPGLREGLRILAKVKQRLGLPVLSDVHCREEVGPAAEVLDVLQVPAFLCRQTDLITEVARAGRPMNIKKGQFLAPWDMRHVIEKAHAAGNRQVLVTERGTSFGYNNLVSDLRSLQVLSGFGCPIIYDGTHSVQLPGGLGHASGGERRFVPTLVRAAVATGFCHGIFLEVHEDPDRAPVDGPNMLRLSDLPRLLDEVQAIHSALATYERIVVGRVARPATSRTFSVPSGHGAPAAWLRQAKPRGRARNAAERRPATAGRAERSGERRP